MARPDQIAARVAGRAAEEWVRCRGTGEYAVPLGVIASLCLAGHVDARGLLGASDEEITGAMARVWAAFWLRRPDLAFRARLLFEWLDEAPRRGDLVKAAAATARAAVKGGITDLRVPRLLHDVDPVGHMFREIRGARVLKHRGEMYSPPDVCDVLVRIMTAGREFRPGMSIAEPCAGSGGMLRALAQLIRSSGLDPADFWWAANDVADLPVAVLAVNADLWALGHRVVLGVADTLTEPDWMHAAWASQQRAIANRDSVIGDFRLLAAAQSLTAGISPAGAGTADDGRCIAESVPPPLAHICLS